MSQRQHADFVEQHKDRTLAELKTLYYNGQGQVEEGNELWDHHVQLRREGLLEEMGRDMDRKKEIRDIEISKEKYKLLQRYHMKHTQK
jgi:hypothetical protein